MEVAVVRGVCKSWVLCFCFFAKGGEEPKEKTWSYTISVKVAKSCVRQASQTQIKQWAELSRTFQVAVSIYLQQNSIRL